MINLVPVTLEGRGLRLEPLSSEHHDDLVAAAADGKLWELWFTSVPEPAQTRAFIESAQSEQRVGRMRT
jgi:hypothetical protein